MSPRPALSESAGLFFTKNDFRDIHTELTTDKIVYDRMFVSVLVC